MKTFRFAIGSAEGPRSTVWRLWTTNLEFYIKSSMMGNSVKVSIHSEGAAQYSMESDWYGKNRPDQPNKGRHIEKWTWQEPSKTNASLVFLMFVPQCELRKVHTDRDLSNVTWLDAPGEGKQVQVICYVSPAPLAAAPTDAPGFLCALERGEGSIVVFAKVVDVTPEDIEHSKRVKETAIEWARADGRKLQPEYRMAALAKTDAGDRALIEFVATSTTPI